MNSGYWRGLDGFLTVSAVLQNLRSWHLRLSMLSAYL
jgi:hypothetical protein